MRIIIIAGGKEEYIMIKRVLPTNDLAFRKAFATPGNEDILQGIIGDFFEIRPAISDITITAPYSIESYKDVFKLEDGVEVWAAKLRETVRDVSADISFADFGAELQMRKETFFTERSLHYTFSKFCGNYGVTGAAKARAGGAVSLYSSIKPVISLNMLGYRHFTGDDDALRVFTLYDRKRHKSFDVEYITIAYFELVKNNVETANQNHWKAFFQTGEATDDAPEYIKKAVRNIDRANMTQEENEMINRLEMAEEIYKNTLDAAHLEGKIEGERIGEAKGKIEGERIGKIEGERIGKIEGEQSKAIAVARNLLNAGMSVSDISRHTGLAESEIRKLMH